MKIHHRFVKHIGRADGTPYLQRITLLKNRFFSVKIHRFVRSDAELCLHDHPWPFASFVLWRGYFEHTESGVRWRGPGSLAIRPAKHRHRVLLRKRGGKQLPAVTLFITGPRSRRWGFYTSKGFRPWREFTEC